MTVFNVFRAPDSSKARTSGAGGGNRMKRGRIFSVDWCRTGRWSLSEAVG